MIIGIDLGTTNSLVASFENGKPNLLPNSLGVVLTPSVVGVDEDGSILVGQAAKERLQTHPDKTIAAFKRGMGTSKSFQLGKQVFRAEELSSFVLRSLKADAESHFGCAIHSAVVTVPAYFSDTQRQATRSAAVLAGFSSVSLLNEPTAAALAYGLHQEQAETKFLVFDFGGGTFDVSVLELFEGVMEVRATAGDNHLGGEDVDVALERFFIQASNITPSVLDDPMVRARLLSRLEQAKRELMHVDEVPLVLSVGEMSCEVTLSSADLEQAIQPLLDRLRIPVERAMRDARLMPNELNAVVLAGGSTRLRAVRQLVTKMFGRFREMASNPDEVVAMGAAVQAALKMKDEAVSERVMTDVCPYTLGIETTKANEAGVRQEGYMAPILERNTIIPASRTQKFWPLQDYQRILTIRVFQGEGRRVSDNIKLGEFDLNLPHGTRAEVGADVRFTYDANGLLEVEATPMKNNAPFGPTVQLVVENSENRLSPAELKERLEALKSLKVHPRDQMPTRALLARAERQHGQLLGLSRDRLAELITQFEFCLDSQDPKRIAPLRKQLIEMLDFLEKHQVFPDERP